MLLNKKLDKFSLTLIAIISLTHIIVNSFIYLGIDYTQDELMSQYEELALISKDYEEGNYYRVKNEASNMIMNSSLPMKYHTLDHFTSLTDKNNLSSLKKMGYSSMWVKTFSRGGNLLLDSVLANKYIMTRKEVDSPYYELVKKYDGLYFYELIYTPSYGYLINEDDTIFDKDNSFIITNSIYKNITNSNLDIIEVIDEFDSNNIKITKEKDTTWYDIVDEESYNYLEKDIKITDRKVAYLEILRSVNNTENLVVYESFDIYINDKLFIQNAFDENNNGVLNLGYFEDEDLNIKIVFDKDIDLDNITIGLLDQDKYEEFMEGSSSNTTIKYNKNKVVVDVVSASDKTLFLPINYNEGYKATNNGKSVEVVKVYDNFIGIEVSEGINNIEISFIPKGLVPCLIVSMVTLVVSIILIKTGFYFKILDSNVLANMAYYLYMTFYLLFILVIYVGLTLCFIVSYFKYIIV